MAGMYTLCHYERFSLTDVAKFERRLRKWCNEECMHGKSMLIYDKPSLLVGGEPAIKNEEGQSFYQVVLPNITLDYICIVGSMCIMKRIWENKTHSVLYKMPEKWDNCELWLAD